VPATGPRHQARELALKVLFQLENRPDDELQHVLDYHAKDEAVPPSVAQFAAELVRGVHDHSEQLDQLIQEYSRNWRLEQMGRVDRIVLRIAIYEITIARNVPVKAAINESIELAKTFSGDESGRFVNGILGRVAEMADAQ
jgi:N utilization substance protein B